MNRKQRGFNMGTIVRHFKGGVYRIEDFSRHSETGELMVNYRQMFPPYHLFSRPEANFCSPVDHDKYPDAEQEFRFEKLTKDQAMEYEYEKALRRMESGQA